MPQQRSVHEPVGFARPVLGQDRATVIHYASGKPSNPLCCYMCTVRSYDSPAKSRPRCTKCCCYSCGSIRPSIFICDWNRPPPQDFPCFSKIRFSQKNRSEALFALDFLKAFDTLRRALKKALTFSTLDPTS